MGNEMMPRSDSRVWKVATVGLFLVAIALRAWIHFRTPFPPGMDAGYYATQTRSLLVTGHLEYREVPLLFWIDAIVAKCFQIGGLELSTACLRASQWVDCISLPLAAFPIMAMAKSWSGRDRSAIIAGIAAASIALLSICSVRMIGDFQKNSLGLLWLACTAWALHRCLTRHLKSDYAWVAGFLFLAGLTHIGAFGATFALVVLATVLHAALSTELTLRRRVGPALISLAVGLGLLGALALVAPSKLSALKSGLSKLFNHGPAHFHPDLGSGFALRAVFVLAALFIVRVVVDRNSLRSRELALPGAALLVSIGLTYPYYDPQYSDRLSLMAPMLLSVSGAWTLVAFSRTDWGKVLSGACILAVIFITGFDWRVVVHSQISASAAQELLSMKPLIKDPTHSTVIARHGMEFWAAYFLNTKSAQRVKSTGQGTIYQLVENMPDGGPGGPEFGGSPMGQGPMGPPPDGGQGMGPGGPPPDGAGPGSDGPMGNGPGGNGPGGSGPGGDFDGPNDGQRPDSPFAATLPGTTLFEGDHFSLVQLAANKSGSQLNR